MATKDNSYNFSNSVSISCLGLGAGLFFGYFIPRVGIILAVAFAIISVVANDAELPIDDVDKLFGLLTIFLFIGIAIGGYIGFQQSQINALQANAITKVPLSTYQGTVQAVYNNSPSYIKFTSGNEYTGNLSKVSNLSAGEVCTLVLNESFWSTGNKFLNGTCKVS